MNYPNKSSDYRPIIVSRISIRTILYDSTPPHVVPVGIASSKRRG
ncbi:hypothetical protein C5S29_13355 [ANME-1 cluster archaeon GoMg3.2]|nr:hypothetical protein [ANME-1 cluster archaeon GoMg3.2]